MDDKVLKPDSQSDQVSTTPGEDSPSVAVLVDTSTGWGRRLITGVVNYATNRPSPWHVLLEARSHSDPISLPPEWNGDGVIARIASPQVAKYLKSLGKPVVNISSIQIPGTDFPRVTLDLDALAELAVNHFVDRGYQQFAYVGPSRLAYERELMHKFNQAVAKLGATCHTHDYRPKLSSSENWGRKRSELGDWLEQLPKPIGLLSWVTSSGLHVLDVCRNRGIAVPDDIAVLASDEDDLLCSAASPPLSGALVPSEQIGASAAFILDQLMSGQTPDQTEIKYKPVNVVERRSTEALAIQDPLLTQAVAFIRQHAYKPMQVDDVLRVVPISRRSLERLFKQTFGRTPLEEIQRLRLARSRELLVRTDMSIADVAERSGFGTQTYFTQIFKRAFSLTPLRYRAQSRGR
jgi:LacI family transcriptional regulator